MNMVRHKLFFRLLLSYIFTIMLPTFLVSAIYFYTYSNELRFEYEKSVNISLQNLEQKVAMLKNNVDNLSLQLSFMSNLNSILLDPFSAGLYDYSQLNETFKTQVTANRLVHSGYLYFRLNDKILTTNEGLYRLSDFYDKDLIGKAMQNEESMLIVRTLRDRFDLPSVDVITFTRPLPTVRKDVLGSMVINVRKDEFFDALRKLINDDHNDIFILDESRSQVLFNNKNSALEGQVANLLREQNRNSRSGTKLVLLGEESYFVSYTTMPDQPWTIVKLLPDSYFNEKLQEKLVSIVKIVLGIMALGLAFSYMFSMIMYRPWKKILTDYTTIFRGSMHQKKIDEYALVSSAITKLVNENKTIKEMIDQNEPLIRHRLVFDLLHNNIQDHSSMDSRLAQVGFVFPHRGYVVFVVHSNLRDYEASPEYSTIKLFVFSLIESTFKRCFGAAGTLIDDERFGFILNVAEPSIDEALKSTIIGLCREINEDVQEQFNIMLQFSFGNPCSSPDDIYTSFNQAKKMMRYKALIHHSDTVFMMDFHNKERLEYPLHMEKALLNSIKACDMNKSRAILSDLFQLYVFNAKYSRERVQGMIIMLLGSLIRDLLQDGVESESISSDAILKVNHCNNILELEQFMQNYIQSIINELEAQSDRKVNNLYIMKAITFIHEHYHENISVTDISDFAGLSTSYLSRIFKQQTGKSLLDYVTKYRIERSIEMLKQGRKYSLKKIGEMVGFSEVHSFIRCFKKYEGITPGEYRKLHQ